ncbi:RNA polymerase sigma factor [Streptomyces populi]
MPEHSTPAADLSFDELFETGFTRVVRSLVLLGADRGTAEDLAQEAFWTAYQRWNEVRPYDRPIAWVAKTALNKWRQYCRTADRRDGLLARADPLRLVKENKDLAEVDKRLDLRRSLLELPLGQREVIVLRYIIDQSVSDIARTLGRAEGTVKSQLFDARHALADLIADDGEGPNREGESSGPEQK